MPQIQPVHFSTIAHDMIHNIAKNSPAKNASIGNFLKAANKTGQQGNALIAMHSEWAKAQEKYKPTYKNFFDLKRDEMNYRVSHLRKEINHAAETDKTVGSEYIKFIDALNENYPKTGFKRLSILDLGGVVEGKVEPTSKPRKLLIKVSEFINKIINKEC